MAFVFDGYIWSSIYECLACNGVPVVDLILNLVDDVGHGTEGDAGHQGKDQDEDVDLVKREGKFQIPG